MNLIEFKKKSNHVDLNHDSSEKSFNSEALAIGIDLGTTHSVVSVYNQELKKPVILEYEGKKLIPSLVYYEQNSQTVFVGENAKEYLEDHAHEIIRGTKRNIGKNDLHFASNGKSFTSFETAKAILKYILTHSILTEEKEKFGFICAVITVPALFDDASRGATIRAAEAVGIRVIRIINEPTAAALAYSLITEEEKKSHENLVVYDFGGGTFDVTVLEKRGLTFNVLSSQGDVNLGGDDITDLITNEMIKSVEPIFARKNLTKNSLLYQKLWFYAEQAKKVLGFESKFVLQDENIDGRFSKINFEMTREQFDEIVTPFIERSIFYTENSLLSARKLPKNMHRILLVGGSTRLNLVHNLLSSYFACLVDARLEPDFAVSFGACLQAAILMGAQVNIILVDVCSHTLGIGIVESFEDLEENTKQVLKKIDVNLLFNQKNLHKALGNKLGQFNFEIQKLLKVAPIIYRNTSLPAKKSEFFSTMYENQQAIHVVIVQGEEPTVGENKLIGSFLFVLENPCPKGSRCEIQLTYDVNGMIQVVAKQLGTSNHATAKFDSSSGRVLGWEKITVDSEPSYGERLSDESFRHNETPSLSGEQTRESALFHGECIREIAGSENSNVIAIDFAKKQKISTPVAESKKIVREVFSYTALFYQNKYFASLENILLYPLSFSFISSLIGSPFEKQNHFKYTKEIKKLNQEFCGKLEELFFQFFYDCQSCLNEQEKSTEFYKEELLKFEKVLNLSLYYWSFKENRNYNFRSIIQLLGLENSYLNFDKNSKLFLNKSFSSVYPEIKIRICERGLVFDLTSGEGRLAFFQPISHLFDLTSVGSFLNLADDHKIDFLKKIQVEVALMVDEWEFLNSIWASICTPIYQIMEESQNISNVEPAHKKILANFCLKRENLVEWILESLCSFQKFIGLIFPHYLENETSPILKEIKICSSLFIATVQKILLPAAVSCILYGQKIRELLLKYCNLRVDCFPDDFSSQLFLQAMQSSLGEEFSLDSSTVIFGKSFDWSLYFDPALVLKAFSPTYSKQHHLYFVALLAYVYFMKLRPIDMDFVFLDEVSSVLEKPEMFRRFSFSECMSHENKFNIEPRLIEKLFKQLNVFLQKNTKKNEDNLSFINYIRENLMQNEYVLKNKNLL